MEMAVPSYRFGLPDAELHFRSFSVLGLRNLSELLDGRIIISLNRVLICFQSVPFPIHWGEVNAKTVLLGSP